MAVRIEQVEVAQTYSHLPNATYQALVPGKDAWLRAFVVADSAIAAPSVSATLNCTSQPSLTFTGPTTLPTSTPASTNSTNVFIAQVPAACVRTGLQANVTVAAGSRSSAVSRSVAPTVAGATNMHLVLVPLVANGSTGQVPEVATVQRLLSRVFPLAASQIKVSVRAPYTLSSGTVRTSAEWDNALDELYTLWRAEGQGRHYYGVLPDPSYQGGTSGLGYRNNRTNANQSAYLVALGLDAVAQPDAAYGTDAALTTMAHEIGHNLSLDHAPCGVSTYDANFPYTSAGLGPNPVFESDSNRDGLPGPLAVYFPASPYTRDLMSYCGALWFSDYNFRNIQQFLETFSYPNVAAYARPQTLLDFQGSISADQSVTMVAPSARVATQPALGTGDYTLRVVPTQGTAHDYPFQSVAVEDGAQPRSHFRVSVPDPGPIARVEVLYQGRSLPVQLNAPPVAEALASGVSTTQPEAQVQWEEKGGVLELRWDSARYPTLQVRHSDGAQSTVLAARLRGGSARLPLHSLPTGGQWEFSLSAQWNAQLVIGIRP